MTFTAEWAGGFFEGEGCIHFASRTDADVVRLTVTQKYREPLDTLCEILGGKVYGPYEANPGAPYKWSLQKQGEIRTALQRLRPYLVIKQAQADLVLTYFEQRALLRAKRVGKFRTVEEKQLGILTRAECSRLKHTN